MSQHTPPLLSDDDPRYLDIDIHPGDEEFFRSIFNDAAFADPILEGFEVSPAAFEKSAEDPTPHSQPITNTTNNNNNQDLDDILGLGNTNLANNEFNFQDPIDYSDGNYSRYIFPDMELSSLDAANLDFGSPGRDISPFLEGDQFHGDHVQTFSDSFDMEDFQPTPSKELSTLVNSPENTSQPQGFQYGNDSHMLDDLSTGIQYQDPQSINSQKISTSSVMSQSEDRHILISNMESLSSAHSGEAESFEPQSVPELSFSSSPASDLLSPQPATPEIDVQSQLALVTRAGERVNFQLPSNNTNNNNNNLVGNDRVTEFQTHAFALGHGKASLNITNNNSIIQPSGNQVGMHGPFNGVPKFPNTPSSFAAGNPFSGTNMAKPTVAHAQGQALGSSANHYPQVNMILDNHEVTRLGSGSIYPPASPPLFVPQAPASPPASQFTVGQAMGIAQTDTGSIGARNAFISGTRISQSQSRYSKEFGGQFAPNSPGAAALQNAFTSNYGRQPLSVTNGSLSYRQAEQNSNLVRTQSTQSNGGLLVSHTESNQDLGHNRFTPISSRIHQNHLEFNQGSDKFRALPHVTGFSQGQLASIHRGQQQGQDSHARQGIQHNQTHGQAYQKMPIRDVGSIREGSNQSCNQQRSLPNIDPSRNSSSPPFKQSDRGTNSFAEIQKQIDDSLIRGLPLPTFPSTTSSAVVMTDAATVTARTQARNPKLRVQQAPLASNIIQPPTQAAGHIQWAPTIEIGNTPGTYPNDNSTFSSPKKNLKRTRAVADFEEVDPDMAMVNNLYNIKDTRQHPAELQPRIQAPGMIPISHIPINPTVQYYIDQLNQQNLAVTTRTTKAGAVKRSAPKRKKITLDNINWEYCHKDVTPQSSLKAPVGISAYNIHDNPLIGKNIWTPMEDCDSWSYEPHETTSSFMMFFNSSSYTAEERLFLYTDVGIWREEFGETGRFDEGDIDRMVANGWSFDGDRDIIIH